SDVRPAHRRHLPLVHAPAWHRRRDLRQWKLPRRRHLAACCAPLRGDPWLAQHLRRHRSLLHRDRVGVGAIPAPQAARRRHRRFVCRKRLVVPPFRILAGRRAIAPLRRRRGCVAMSMPQVHIVAYCGDLGYGVARGAEMLSVMLGFGIVSRLLSGMICDRIGGLRTLLLGSALQGVALLLFLPFDGLVSLYVISALFGLFQGGIVPSYAIIIREYFPSREAGARVGTVLMFTLLGMALGGWMSGK